MPTADNTNDQARDADAELLPPREVMSVLTGDSTMPMPIDTIDYPAASDAAGTASGTADSASGLAETSADASGSGEESATSEDRSDHIESSDSAYAGP